MTISATITDRTPLGNDGELPSGPNVGVNLPKPVLATGLPETYAPCSKIDNLPYSVPLNKEYAYKPRKLRVFTIGAGFSGLLMAHKFQHRFPELADIVEHTIFEARKDIGGTWLVNHYPGVQCDVPAHIYVSCNLRGRPSKTYRIRHFHLIRIQTGADSIPVAPRSKRI